MNRRLRGFEVLERRMLLAGTVLVEVKAGDLLVTGDKGAEGLDETIQIVQLASGQYEVKGLNDTTVTGAAQPLTVTRHIKIDLKKGDNSVVLTGESEGVRFLVPTDLSVKTLDGTDGVAIGPTSVGGKVTIDTGKGDDTVLINDMTVTKDVSIKTGDGDDMVDVADATLKGHVTIDAGNATVTVDEEGWREYGTDSVQVRGQTHVTGNLSVTTGNGHDVVSVGEEEDQIAVGKAVTIKTGSGGDEVGVAGLTSGVPGLTGGRLSVTTGNDDDMIGITDTTVIGNAAIDAGNATVVVWEGEKEIGTDSVAVADMDVTGSLTVKTGKGMDEVEMAGLTSGRLSVTTGNEDDTVEIADASIAGDASIDAGNATIMVWDGEKEIGTDSVVVRGMDVTGGLKVKTGNGHDVVAVLGQPMEEPVEGAEALGEEPLVDKSEVGKALTIQTGSGADSVGLNEVTALSLNVTTGNDDDVIGIVAAAVTADALLDSGNASSWREEGETFLGGDQVGVTGSDVGGKLTIKTGNGEDEVGMGSDPDLVDTLTSFFEELLDEVLGTTGAVTVGRACSISTGSGGDGISIWDSESESLNVDTGAGDDWADIWQSIADSVVVKMGAGDDELNLDTDVDPLPASMNLDGGSHTAEGGDLLNASGIEENNPFPPYKVLNWEDFGG